MSGDGIQDLASSRVHPLESPLLGERAQAHRGGTRVAVPQRNALPLLQRAHLGASSAGGPGADISQSETDNSQSETDISQSETDISQFSSAATPDIHHTLPIENIW
jgi:hypothetical protein